MFQNYVNEFFRKFLIQLVTIYLNNILIYGDNKKNTNRRFFKNFTKKIFINKCEFLFSEMKYFLKISQKKEIKINFEKIKIILKQKTSKSITNVLQFLKFSNFYKRFIEEFFKKIIYFTKSTKKTVRRFFKKKTKYRKFR